MLNYPCPLIKNNLNKTNSEFSLQNYKKNSDLEVRKRKIFQKLKNLKFSSFGKV